MRAFMSTGSVHDYAGRTSPGAGIDALREARAILAVTEPFVRSRDEFNVGRISNTEHSDIGSLAMCSPMYQALAEALAAFVED